MPSVIIIGGGLAGLSAANYLHQSNIDFQLLEASPSVGGRVQTDNVDGYLLDHGFQVLLTAYPEAQRLLDYDQLNLQRFLPGASLLLENGKINRIGDPLRDFSSLVPTLTADVGSVFDKLKILRANLQLGRQSMDDIFNKKETTTAQALSNRYGFSPKMINHFFKPFFSGIFLEKDLTTSSRMFDFVFKMFGEGHAAVPNGGMGQISQQLANNLPKGSMQTNAKVTKIDQQIVYLEDGSSYTAPHIILATNATQLVKEFTTVKPNFQSTTHLHFIADAPPSPKPLIALNTKTMRLANNICCINNVAKGYATTDKSLVSISVVGDHKIPESKLAESIQKELTQWYADAPSWQHLHTRKVRYALPNQSRITNAVNASQTLIRKGLYMAGDHLMNGSINAAMKSGRVVAEGIVAESKIA